MKIKNFFLEQEEAKKDVSRCVETIQQKIYQTRKFLKVASRTNLLSSIMGDDFQRQNLGRAFYKQKKDGTFYTEETNISPVRNGEKIKLEKLIEYAKKMGAAEAKVISTTDIVIEDNLADMCREPQCSNYGLSKNCPPHVSGPSGFRKKLENFNNAIIFKIDVPSEILFSSERLELFQLLHEIAAGIEQYAVKMGFKNSEAYAGDSCKAIFCYDHLECRVLSEKGKCRNPQYARPSMSGFGINVSKLMRTAGWTLNKTAYAPDAAESKTESVCGLVLIY